MFTSALKSFNSNISANYQISPNPTVYSGPWKIHDAKKKSTGTAASVFIFDRKSLETRSNGLGRSSGSSNKRLNEDVIERLKREASNLTRLRHPSILQVLEPVEETRNGGLMFATEHLTASLSGLLREKDDLDNTTRAGSRTGRYMVEEADGTKRRKEVEIDELEVQKGLLQVAKGLEFLHESAGLVHGNLNPEAIYINAKSDWKISGLGYAGPPDSSESKSSLPPLAVSEVLYQDPKVPASVRLNLDYTSPDFAVDSNVSSAADLFSLGLIIVSLYNSPHTSPLQTHGNLTTYKKLLSSPSTTPSQGNNFLCSNPIPKDVLSHVLPRLITRRPAQRMDAREFQQSQYFDNILVSTIRFLESLPAKSPNEKSQFLRGLQRVLSEFPVSVLEKKLLGALMDELKDRELVPLILQNVFRILQRIPNGRRVFPEKIIPQLKEVFGTGSSKKPSERDPKKDAGLMVVLENMKLISSNCSGIEFKDGKLHITTYYLTTQLTFFFFEEILPLIRLGLDSPTHSLVDASIKCLPVMLPVLDFSTVKNEVFPPIAATFSRTSSLAIKVRSLEAFSILCGASKDADASDGLDDDLSGVVGNKATTPKAAILDKYTIQEKLVPSLKAMKTKEPSVMMAGLGVFRQVGVVADTEFLALEVLPVLWNFSLGPLLNLNQFNEFMALIKTISTRIEQEQSKKLQELSSASGSTGFQNGANEFSQSATGLGSPDTDGAGSFERLVLGKQVSSPNGEAIDMWGGAEHTPSKAAPQSMSPSFSWSSNNTGMAQQANFLAQPPGSGSRSITPDQKLSSIPSLTPATHSWQAPSNPRPPVQFPPMQPQPSSSIWGTPANSTVRPQMGASSPSLTSMSTMTSSNYMSGPTAAAPNYSSFSIPAPPTGGTGVLNVKPTSFQGIGPPQQPTQKQGLDKYESLI